MKPESRYLKCIHELLNQSKHLSRSKVATENFRTITRPTKLLGSIADRTCVAGSKFDIRVSLAPMSHFFRQFHCNYAARPTVAPFFSDVRAPAHAFSQKEDRQVRKYWSNDAVK